MFSSSDSIFIYIALGIFIVIGFNWACSGNGYDGVKYKDYHGSEEEHRRYINREMTKWEATVYENWTSRGFFGKMETIMGAIIIIILCHEAIKILLAAAFLGLGLIVVILAICVIGGFPFLFP